MAMIFFVARDCTAYVRHAALKPEIFIGLKVVLFPESPTTHPNDTFKAIFLEMH